MSKFIPVLIILVFLLGLIYYYVSKETNVLGTSIAQGRQLQLDWFRPLILVRSPAPRASVATPRPSSVVSVPSPSASSNQCPHYSNGPLTRDAKGNLMCECVGFTIRCQAGRCVEGEYCNLPPVFNRDSACQSGDGRVTAPKPDGYYCVAKPVIYLYPKEKTVVDVKMTMSEGLVAVSDPLYDEKFKGWDDVTAFPDGTLYYQGEKYSELFYEQAVKDVKPLPEGIIIRKESLRSELTRITTQLGLVQHEQNEFLEYWLPTLEGLNSPYILFSLIGDKEKERIDNVSFSPKPDTFIWILAYFKPLNQMTDVKPLVLPAQPPERVGFTAVEWGGTIEPENKNQ